MESMELDSLSSSMSISDNDAVELGTSSSTSDIEELYPSECEERCKLNLDMAMTVCTKKVPPRTL